MQKTIIYVAVSLVGSGQPILSITYDDDLGLSV